ncbi:Mlp family lipoprotein (plasmid) [Borrelia coriaceae]|uniref:Mlp lipoprotein family protein n=1 Tax=Borrelia coriaceae ATCC 43381 TaxID=1408429 RepID=W5SWQ5_9SPIR|nr:Mlp family lipoprotein [Borrelia coriaceae]AHH11629.1 Mlp lipoprotein family protein [Borrelia coriaceae ATCC 43381]UPA17480.1 Mlp family lipoprotein [Borrelia coriaceae]
MKIFIKTLIFCSTLLLYCCNSDKINGTSDKTIPILHKLPKQGENNLQPKAHGKDETRLNTLTDDENQKFDVLINAFNKIIELKRVSDDASQKSQNFLNWIRSTEVQKQKELANAFTIVYEALKDKKPPQLKNLTITQLINNALTCPSIDQCNDTYTNIRPPDILMFFRNVLKDTISANNTNAKRFKALKIELLNLNQHVHSLLEGEQYEIMLRMQIKNDNNLTQAFNFLINALPQNNRYIAWSALKLLFEFNDNGMTKSIDLEKLKSILNHINTELNKCNKNEAGKNNLATSIKDYLVKVDRDNTPGITALNNFATEILSDCQK